jgi:hypothetical protein
MRRSGTTPCHQCGVVLARKRPGSDAQQAFDEASFRISAQRHKSAGGTESPT